MYEIKTDKCVYCVCIDSVRTRHSPYRESNRTNNGTLAHNHSCRRSKRKGRKQIERERENEKETKRMGGKENEKKYKERE